MDDMVLHGSAPVMKQLRKLPNPLRTSAPFATFWKSFMTCGGAPTMILCIESGIHPTTLHRGLPAMTRNHPHVQLDAADTRGWSKATILVLAALTVISFFNYTDRVAVAVLIEPIKKALLLSDTQAGLITGLAFALFYAVLGVPIGRLADSQNKVKLLIVCFLLWSGATALSGTATSFFGLFMARLLVGVGEAGCLPASFAIISERFTARQRPLVISIFHAGGRLGTALGMAGAGLAGQLLGWRTTLIAVGAIGVPVALLVALALRGEGARQSRQAASAPRAKLASILEVPGVGYLIAAISMSSFATYGITQWLPAFLVRSHGATLGAAGMWSGTTTGAGGILGTIAGGMAATWLIRRHRSWDLWLPAVVYGIAAPLFLLALFSPTLVSASSFYFAATLVATSGGGVVLAAFQRFTVPAHRATANGFMLMVSAITGVGLGPLAVGVASDLMNGWLGVESLRWALAVCATVFLLASCLYLQAARKAANNVDTEQ
jgi:predicted MFS family arabinose efflux permease